MENKRLLLALLLTFLVLAGWSILFPPPKPVPPAEPVQTSGSPHPAPAAEPPQGASPTPVVGPELDVPAATTATSVRDLRVETPLYRLSLSGAGGTIRGWSLLRYRAHAALPGQESGPVELVSPAAADGLYAPLGIATGDRTMDEKLAQAVFEVEGEDLSLAAGQRGQVTLRWSDGQGTSIRKTLEFDGSTYAISVTVEARIAGQDRRYLLLGPNLAEASDKPSPTAYVDRAAIFQGGSKVERVTRQQIDLGKVREATGGAWPVVGRNWIELLDGAGAVRRMQSVPWAAIEQNYFASVAYGETPFEEVLVLPVLHDLQSPPRLALGLRLGDSARFQLLGAPKDTTILSAVRPDLVHLVEFGFFSVIARALLVGLQFLYRFVGNYGLAIILLTVVIKLLFLPLSIKQLSAMQKMAKLRPQLKQIEDRHRRALADPKQRLEASRKKQAEMMALYQQEGVNPASGCLPLLLQLPVLWGFYNLLGSAIELRHAPFMLWIQDLSAKDPFYVTPALMVLSQIVMQAVTPAIGDPMQRKLMYIMPVFFGWIFKDLASGLVLYWLTQNVLSVVQQVWLNRLTQRREEREKEARRQAKGKSERKGLEEA